MASEENQAHWDAEQGARINAFINHAEVHEKNDGAQNVAIGALAKYIDKTNIPPEDLIELGHKTRQDPEISQSIQPETPVFYTDWRSTGMTR